MRNIVKVSLGIVFCILCLSACACKSVDTESNISQFIEVANADGEIVRQVTDEQTIIKLTENERIEEWEEVHKVPDNAKKLYVFTTYALVTDPAFQNSDEPEITVDQEILYFDGTDYYLEESSNEVVIDKIPKTVGEYLIKFADEKSVIEDKENIFSSWGIDTSKIPENFIYEEEYGEEQDLNEDENYDKYPYQDVEEFTYSGLQKASKYQKIEINLGDDIVYSATDLNTIADILNNVDMPHWESVNTVPDDASLSYILVRYAHPKKTVGSNVVEIERWEIYKNQSDYYLHSIVVGDESSEVENYLLPKTSGKYLDSLWEK